MLLFKHECRDMGESRQTGNKSGSSIKNRLQRGEANFGEANKEGITIVDTRANKGMNYLGKNRRRNRSSDCLQASEMVIAGAGEISNVVRERERAIKCHT